MYYLLTIVFHSPDEEEFMMSRFSLCAERSIVFYCILSILLCNRGWLFGVIWGEGISWGGGIIISNSFHQKERFSDCERSGNRLHIIYIMYKRNSSDNSLKTPLL